MRESRALGSLPVCTTMDEMCSQAENARTKNYAGAMLRVKLQGQECMKKKTGSSRVIDPFSRCCSKLTGCSYAYLMSVAAARWS